jgi:hypothetical protein
MKKIVLLLTFVVAPMSTLPGCDKTPTDPQQAQKQKQQEEADKRALRGEFKKSQGKSY